MPEHKFDILICIRSLDFQQPLGGAETQSLRLASRLLAEGNQATIVAGRPGWGLPYLTESEWNGSQIPFYWIETPPVRLVGSMWYLFWIAVLLVTHPRKYRILQIISFHLVQAPLAPIGHFTGRRVIMRAVSGEFARPSTRWLSDGNLSLRGLAGRVYAWMLNHCDRMIAQNQGMIDDLTSIGIERSRIVRIYNGVNTEVFRPADDLVTALRVELNLPGVSPIICCVGMMRPDKHIDDAVRVHKRLLENFPNAFLVLMGDGPQREQIRELAHELNSEKQICFAGFIRDTRLQRGYLNVADVFLLPSEIEGHSNALIEALACGLPAVVTNIDGNRDTIQDGVNGLLVPPGDVPAMAAAIERILEDEHLAARLGANARQSVLEKYSFDAMVQNYLDLYTSLTEPEVQRSE